MKSEGYTRYTRILPVILAGGIGARLAPISTEACPKPFVSLGNNESLFTRTLRRVQEDALFLPPLIIGRAADRFSILNHARAVGITPAAILLEDTPRNTAAAVALAVAWAHIHQPDTVLAILPADHVISPVNLWRHTVQMAAEASVDTQQLCLLMAPPRAADPNFGYILCDAAPTDTVWGRVEMFVEKPDAPEALIHRGAGWNMGQFIAPQNILAQHYQDHAASLWSAAKAALAASHREWEFTMLPPLLVAAPFLPVDRAIVEQVACIALPFAGEWHDLGTVDAWQEVTGLGPESYAALPVRTDRPWGYFEVMETSPSYTRKQLVIYPGCRLSRQRHFYRQEYWKVREGVAHVEFNNEIMRLEVGEELTIPQGVWHRLSNFHQNIVIIEEIQTGNCDESDIERVEDDYGRVA